MNGISVNELITNKPFLFGKEPVISGANGLNRLITNINVMEVPDVFNWVRKGDLLLTTAYSIKDNLDAQNELIPRLSENGIAAIGIKTKRYLNSVPLEMIDLSNKHGLPILELAYQYGYSQTISEVLEEVINNKSRWLMEQHQKIQLLTNTLIMGETSKTFIETFNDCTGLNSYLITYDSDLLSNDHSFINDWPSDTQLFPAKLSSQSINFSCFWLEADKRKLYIPIEKNNETIAYFVCQSRDEDEWEHFQLILQHTISLLTFQITFLYSQNNLQDKQKDLFLKNWVLGKTDDLKTITIQAASFGLQLKPEYCICITSIYTHHSSKELSTIKNYCILQGILMLIIGNEWVLLIPNYLTKQKNFYNQLHAEFIRTFKNSNIRIGISNVKSISSVHEGYQEALSSLDIWEVIDPEEKYCFYDKLGMYPIVQFLSNEASINKQLYQYIEPLHAYDIKNNSNLVDTLITFLNCGGNIKQTAQALFCHYNSIVYRLERIQGLLGVDIKDPDIRFHHQVAVKVHSFSQKKGLC